MSLIFLADGYNRDQASVRLLGSAASKDQDRAGSESSQMHLSRRAVSQRVSSRDDMSQERDKGAYSVIVAFK